MKEWQIRQEIYHRISPPDDYHSDKDEMLHSHDALLTLVKSYFTDVWDEKLQYPAKTYAVALIYAVLIEHYFGDRVVDTLNCAALLYHNDKHFVAYSSAPEIYDGALPLISAESLLSSPLPQVQTTVQSFHDEFLVTRA